MTPPAIIPSMYLALHGIMGQVVSQRQKVELVLKGRDLVGEVVFDMGPRAIVCGYGIYEDRNSDAPVMWGKVKKMKFGRMGGVYTLKLVFHIE